MKKQFLLCLGFLFLAGGLWSQQQEHYTQFMYNKMYFNPAFAGSNEAPCLTTLLRAQWLGIEGAPQSQVVSFNTPLFNQRVGAGITLLHESIGLTDWYTAEAAYAYRIRMGRGTLALGLSGSIRFLQADFNAASPIQPITDDQAIPMSMQSKYVPNFGAGLYYTSHKFYLGAAVPRLLETNIDLADTGETISREVPHAYLMGGFIVNFSEKVQFQPQWLLKYVSGAPFDADFNLNFIFADRFTTGVSYRLGGSENQGFGESLSLVFGVQISEPLFFGIAYDATISGLSDYNNGSMEGLIRYCFGGRSEGEEYISPRFF